MPKDEDSLLAYVGERIRKLRTEFNGGEGLSQEALASKLGVQANTISRWENAQYQPDLRDLDRLARFFGVSILSFFPGERPSAREEVNALFRAIGELPDTDVAELRRFAEFRRAQALFGGRRPARGRKPAAAAAAKR